MSKSWSDGYSEHSVPDEKSNKGMFGDGTFFPSNFGVSYICNDSSDGSSDKIGKPYKIVVFNDEIGKNCKKGIIKASNADTYYKVAESMLGSFDICLGV